MTTSVLGRALHSLAVVSTVIDAGAAFARRDHRSGALLLGAAVLSTRVSGVGVAVSVLVRLYRRLR